MPTYKHILLATLGGQPQIVTFTFDLLLREHFDISEVIALHPNATQPRIQHSVACLKAQFVGNRYDIDGRTIDCSFRSHILRHNNVPLDDVIDDVGANGVFDTVYHLIYELKQQPCHIHLSITGGRRMMGLLAMSAAQLKFDHFDHIWHIATPEEVKQQAHEGALMHVPLERGINLIKVPFAPWGAYFPHLPQLPDASATSVLRAQIDQMDAKEDFARCRQVLMKLRERQREVLHLFVRRQNRQQVAEQLGISLKTVDTHTATIITLCREVWNLEPDELRGYYSLPALFEKYFDSDEYTPPEHLRHQKKS